MDEGLTVEPESPPEGNSSKESMKKSGRGVETKDNRFCDIWINSNDDEKGQED